MPISAELDLRILGPLEVRRDGTPVALGGAKQRVLLARLLLTPNEPVLPDQLIEDLWCGRPPASAAHSIQVYVSALRKALGAGALVRSGGGYAVVVGDGQLDLARFEQLVGEARRAEPIEAVAQLEDALALWRGPALADFRYESWAQRPAAQLEEQRLAALERRIELEVDLGRHAKAVPELEALVDEHPLREGPRQLLMLALYRVGRQADALEAYQRCRTALRDQLGLDPSPELQELYRRILNHDAALRLAGTPPPLPMGTLTLLMADIEGSTRLLYALGESYEDALGEYRRLIREAVARHRGTVVDSEGDGLFAVFTGAQNAVSAAAEAQRALSGGPVRARIGIHTGEPQLGAEGYVGLDVHRAARICSAAHGGQILVSESSRRLIESEVRDLGEYTLRDMVEPERLFELVVPGLDDNHPAPRAARAWTNLPAPPNRLVGRERELDVLSALLARPDVRLVTLTGPAGVGKTRLAVEAASQAAADRADGVVWVPLAPLRDPLLVLPTIARAIGPGDDVARPPLETLLTRVGGKRMLLLLDNCEHLLEPLPFLAELLARCRQLKLVCTSREPLHLAAEHEYPVPPLAEHAAMSLFLERAVTDERGLEPDADVAAICRRLDCLPLAIELAAARVKVLSPAQILARLEKRLALLGGGPRDADARQRTLAASIAWSHDLLSGAEKQLFARLAVFRGGCTLEAAELVCDADLDTLASLVDKSLVRRSGDRFWMLETITEYAGERLADLGDAEALADAHAGYYSRLVEDAAALLHGETEAAVTARLERERDNVRAALGWLRDTGRRERFLRLAAAMGEFWALRLELREGRRWLDVALAQEDGDPATRERVLKFAFWMAYFQNDVARARELAEARAANAPAAGGDAVFGALASQANVAEMEGNYDRARALQTEVVQLARRSGDKRRLSISVTNLSGFVERSGDHDGARALLEEALAIDRELGESGDIARDLENLGWIAIKQGRVDEAEALLHDALGLAHELGYDGVLVDVLGGLAAVALRRGDLDRAARLAGAEEALVASLDLVLDSYVHETRERYFLGPLRSAETDELAAAWAAGRALTLEQAVAFAVERRA